MKISSSAIDVIATLLAIGTASAFVPNSHTSGILQTLTLPTSSTTCFASEIDVETTSESSSPEFPFSDRQVRYAYDEWRLIYAKGDFDSERFKRFKTNHRTLILSNLQAREKAARDGRPVPQWMSLNEYGDYSLEEYEAMLRGETPVNGESSMVYSSSSEQPVRGTQPASQQGQGRATQVVHSDYALNYSNGQVKEYQDQFGRTIRSTQAVRRDDSLVEAAARSVSPTLSVNYANNIDDSSSDTRGTLVIPNDANNNSAQRGTQVVGNNRGTQVIQPAGGASNIRGTQVIQPAGGASNIRGTQVVQPVGGGNNVRGTQVIQRVGGAGNNRGTQVVQPMGLASDIRGTQVVQSADGVRSASSGTQVVNKAGGSDASGGTQVVDGNNTPASDARGTQVLQSSTDKETESEDTDYSTSADTGTLIIPKSDDEEETTASTDRGTVVVGKDDKDSWASILGSLFGDSEKKDDTEEDENDDEVVGSRGTMVIKRSIPLPEKEKPKNPFSFFGSSSDSKTEEKDTVDEETVLEEKASDSNSFFDFLSPKDKSAVTEEIAVAIEEVSDDNKEKPSGGIFSFFGGNVKSTDSRPVRTTISLQKETTTKPKASQAIETSRKTQLIPEKQSENGMPSILSFFGGAKKITEEETARNPSSRPTLIVKKPQKSQFWSGFSTKKTTDEPAEAPSPTTTNQNDVIAARIARQKEGVERAAKRKAEIAKEREAKRLEAEQKRLEATRRREEQARQRAGRGTKAVTPKGATETTTQKSSSPFKFFGAIGQKATPPSMKNWKQNRDGSITGLIYGSKSFKDGTRITTSPVPRGAKRGSVVETSGGSKYSLT